MNVGERHGQERRLAWLQTLERVARFDLDQHQDERPHHHQHGEQGIAQVDEVPAQDRTLCPKRDAKVVLEHLSSSSPEEEAGELGDRMMEAVTLANLRVWEASLADPAREGMGTTVTALALDQEATRWIIGHVGDSRGYVFRNGELRRITRDHTVVQDLLESGAISPSSTADHPLGHLINRAVGTEETVQVDIFEGDVLPGDIFMLCTDGLAGLISDDELEDTMDGLAIDGLDEKNAELVALAHERGAPDNVTLCFLAVEDVA